MLALNAAIQAATAGEQGNGFSMVTEEVRRLAQRSANAAREIASLVKSIQDDTNAAVVAMEESTSEVVEGSKVADNAGQALNSIEQVVSRLADLILNISQVSLQQASTSASIASSMTEISSLTQEATALRRQSGEVVEMVARTAEDLRSSVSAFKVSTDKDAAVQETAQYIVPDYQFIPPTPESAYPQSNGNNHQVEEAKGELNSIISEESDFFDSIFGEVATASPGAPKPGDKDKPQALG
jgi:chromosome segregation ATPase